MIIHLQHPFSTLQRTYRLFATKKKVTINSVPIRQFLKNFNHKSFKNTLLTILTVY